MPLFTNKHYGLWSTLAGILFQKGQRGLIPHSCVSAVCHSVSVEVGRSQLKILCRYLPRPNFAVFCGGKEINETREISNLVIWLLLLSQTNSFKSIQGAVPA